MAEWDYATIWFAVFLGIFATFMWRAAGVILADKIPADSALMRWINMVAYAMVSGVMLAIMVYPTGILAETELLHRLTALLLGISVMLKWGHVLGAIILGLGSFAFMHLFL